MYLQDADSVSSLHVIFSNDEGFKDSNSRILGNSIVKTDLIVFLFIIFFLFSSIKIGNNLFPPEIPEGFFYFIMIIGFISTFRILLYSDKPIFPDWLSPNAFIIILVSGIPVFTNIFFTCSALNSESC